MRFTVIALASMASFLVACSRSPDPQVMVQPQLTQVQPQVAQPQVEYQQPQVMQAQPAQPPVVYVQPQQQPVIVQNHDSTGALITGMALGSLMSNSGGNTTVYRDRYMPAPAVATNHSTTVINNTTTIYKTVKPAPATQPTPAPAPRAQPAPAPRAQPAPTSRPQPTRAKDSSAR